MIVLLVWFCIENDDGSQWYGRVRNGTGGFGTRPYGQSDQGHAGIEPSYAMREWQTRIFMRAVENKFESLRIGANHDCIVGLILY